MVARFVQLTIKGLFQHRTFEFQKLKRMTAITRSPDCSLSIDAIFVLSMYVHVCAISRYGLMYDILYKYVFAFRHE